MSRRRGASLVELIVALTLTALLCALVAAPFIAVLRLARRHGDRLVLAGALRLPVVVLRGELRWLDPDADIAALADDSLALRAFRGEAVVCGLVDDGVLVRYRGARDPSPEKDSVVVAAGAGAPATAALQADSPAPGECAPTPGGTVRRWTIAAPVSRGTLLLVFERGSYHLADHAFRFRRGLAGRQPLTPERFDGESGLRAIDADGRATTDPAAAVAAALRLVPLPGRDGVAPAVPASLTALRLPMLNRPTGPRTGRPEDAP